jgi:NitT/TauT family transport system ATP-binding protein
LAAKVVVEHVKKSFSSADRKRTVDVLGDVSFTVDDGEIVSVIGPTGGGKSTLLRIIGGVIPPDSGRVEVGGKEVVTGENPASAIVFQGFNLFPWRNVIKNVEFGLEAHEKDPEERARVAQKYVELVGLKGFEKYHPHELSGGMQQRVGLARALAIDPEVILLDEPFSSVDLLTRESLQQEVLKILIETKKTAIFVTHSIDEAIVLSNRVISLGDSPGRIKGIFPVELPYPRTDEALLTEKALALRLTLKHDLLRTSEALAGSDMAGQSLSAAGRRNPS